MLFKASFSEAKPHSEAPTGSLILEEEQVTPPLDPFVFDSIIISEPPELKYFEIEGRRYSKADYYHAAQQAITTRIGVVFGLVDSSDSDSLMNYILGFNYLVRKLYGVRWEVGADFTTLGQGHVHLGRRRIYNQKGSFRPYYKYGITNKVVPEDKMAGFVSWENYLARVGIGFEDLVKIPRHIRFELEAAAGKNDVLVMFTYGYSFAW